MKAREKRVPDKHWTIMPLWSGQTCAVLASGPSMSAEVVAAIKPHPGIRVIAVNRTWELAPWADVLYASDALWWTTVQSHLGGKSNYEHAKPFRGHKVCIEDTPYDDVLQVKNGGRDGFADDRGTIRHGGNSGYAAVHLAAHLGVRRILLCGFDMHGGHWHEDHVAPLRKHGDGIFERWQAAFATLAPELAKRDIEVLNCTPGSRLRCFPMADLGQALETRSAIAA